MKKIVILIFLIASLSVVFSQTNNFKSVKTNKMEIYWKIEKENITFKLIAPTTGWVAIGFEPTNKMENANLIIGYIDKDGKVQISDDFGVTKTKHKPDTEIGGQYNILSKSGSEKDGITELIFTIPLDSKDKYDKKLEVGKTYKIIVAFGKSDNFTSMHKYDEKISIQL